MLRRNAQNQISMEVMKKEDASINKTQFIIKSAYLKTSNKQRTTILELVPVSSDGQTLEQCLLFPSEFEPDIKPWFAVIDHALKNSAVDVTDNAEEKSEPSLSEAINEAVSFVSSTSGRSMQ